MTTDEFSDGFTTLVNSYAQIYPFGKQDTLAFDEYEKSLYLTQAQEELVISCYDGKNRYGDYFESSEELRRQLDSLVKTVEYDITDALVEMPESVSDDSVFFELPEDLAYITLEQITLGTEPSACYEGKRINVQPILQDEFNKVKENPFRGPTKYKALRLDAGERIVEIVSKYDFSKYIVRYVSKPTPIILIDLPDGLSIDGVSEKTECQLNTILHKTILERAVFLALRSKGININTK